MSSMSPRRWLRRSKDEDAVHSEEPVGIHSRFIYRCTTCREFNTLGLKRDHTFSEGSLGTLIELAQRPDCAICTAIHSILDQARLAPSADVSSPIEFSTQCEAIATSDRLGPCVRIKLGNLDKGTIRNIGESGQTLLRRKASLESISRLDEVLKAQSGSPWDSLVDDPETFATHAVSHLLISPKTPSSSSSIPSKFSHNENRVSISLLRDWLNNCMNQHHGTCSKSVLESRNSEHVEIRLIDVVNKCLVKLNSNVRYCALSYVWGGIQGLQLTSKNIHSLMERGGLFSQPQPIPVVIQDAITLVAALRLRYLWVDQLSIPQDDPKGKLHEISQMDSIYSQAFLTIVTLSAKDADTRLPGIRAGSRRAQPIAFAGKSNRLVYCPPTLQKMLKDCPYEARAWTMQERMLSKRCLFFSDQGLYFQCLTNIKAEVGASVLGEKTASTSTTSNPLAADQFWQYDNGAWSWQVGVYKQLVQSYSRRQLSFQSDVINAFSGITGAMQKCGAGKFVFGIPAREPEMGLLWIPESDIKRRCVETEGKAMPIFPSWTWAGWSGPVRWPATLSRGGAVAPVPGSPVEVRWLPKRAESSLGIPANSLSASDDMACELSVRTSTSQDFYFYDPVSIQWEGQISYKIYNSEGHHCGAIYTSEELWTVDSNQPYKFVLLSSVLLSDEHLDSWVSKRFPVFDHMEYAITKRCLRNVMLVRMLGKGYVERLAVCQIHKDAWASALTEEDTIRFI